MDWLKKKLDCSLEQKRQLIEPDQRQISLRRQCQLLGIHRSGLYYQEWVESGENLRLMRLFDEQDTHCPFYGVRRMTGLVAAARFCRE